MNNRKDKVSLILIRGLTGSGKTTLATHFSGVCRSADDYFLVGGEYRFDPSKLQAAHADCLQRTVVSLAEVPLQLRRNVIVANTFSCRWEMEPYFKAAEEAGATVIVVDLFDGGLTDEQLFKRNVHGVPLNTIQAMRSRWEHDWKNGNPLPPWERREERRGADAR